MTQTTHTNLTKRLTTIALLALAMSVPLALVDGIVNERGRYYDEVIAEIAARWGQRQDLHGPLLVIPFTEQVVTEEVEASHAVVATPRIRTRYRERHAVVLPQTLDLDIDITHDYRRRALYETLVYTASVRVDARFELPDFAALSSAVHRIDWHKARVVIGISDTRAIDRIPALEWNGASRPLTAGTSIDELITTGIHAPLDGALDGTEASHELTFTLDVNGSQGLRFAPLGAATHADLRSPWPHPSFVGDLLPHTHTIDDTGFTAAWEVPHLARNYPQAWILEGATYDLGDVLAGVDLYEPMMLYARITRAVKYGILIIALTYLTFLVFELTTATALHLVQYGLIGAALAMFYLLLLSLAEHIGFASAYAAASAACVGMISVYVAAATRSRARGGLLFALLGGAYAVLYALLQMEDYALLCGTLVLFALIGALMYLTRHLQAVAADAGAPSDATGMSKN